MTNELKPCPRCGSEVELDCFQTFSWCNMELNREQIIKALECLASNDDVLGEGCAYQRYSGLSCQRAIARDALALIRELSEKMNTVRAETIMEFAEKIDEASYEGRHGALVEVASIDDIVKKMLGNDEDFLGTYTKGEKITSVDEIFSQELVFIKDTIYHTGYVRSLQLWYIGQYVERGLVFRVAKEK